METIESLQNPDVMQINGLKYQVLKHFELWYDDIKEEMNMCIELTKSDDPQISACVRLIYVKERPSQVTLHKYDAAKDRYLPTQLNSLNFE